MKPYDFMYLVPKDQYESQTSGKHGLGEEPLARVGGDLQESQFNKIDVSNGGTVIIREGIQGGSASMEGRLREDYSSERRASPASKTASRSGKKRAEEEEEEEEAEEDWKEERRRRQPQIYRKHGRHASQDAQFDLLRENNHDEWDSSSPEELLDLEERGPGRSRRSYAAVSNKLPKRAGGPDLRTKVLLRAHERAIEERKKKNTDPDDDVDMQSIASERPEQLDEEEDMEVDDIDLSPSRKRTSSDAAGGSSAKKTSPTEKKKVATARRKRAAFPDTLGGNATAKKPSPAMAETIRKNNDSQVVHDLREAFKDKKKREAASKYPPSRFRPRSKSEILSGEAPRAEEVLGEWTEVHDHTHHRHRGVKRPATSASQTAEREKYAKSAAQKREREEVLDELDRRYASLTKRMATRPPRPGERIPEKRKIENDVDNFLDALTGKRRVVPAREPRTLVKRRAEEEYEEDEMSPEKRKSAVARQFRAPQRALVKRRADEDLDYESKRSALASRKRKADRAAEFVDHKRRPSLHDYLRLRGTPRLTAAERRTKTKKKEPYSDEELDPFYYEPRGKKMNTARAPVRKVGAFARKKRKHDPDEEEWITSKSRNVTSHDMSDSE